MYDCFGLIYCLMDQLLVAAILLADKVYRDMRTNKMSQSIIVSGKQNIIIVEQDYNSN